MANVKILATGGTIAGKSISATDMTNYAAGTLGIDELLANVPEIKNFADIAGENVCNIDSKDITEEILLNLAAKINKIFANDAADAIIVTHGTDTLEETAYFLNLTVHSDKPVILTGAMRPATAIGSDGAINLLNAVKVAANPDSKAKGVLVVLNNEIHAAREVTKTHTLNVNAFKSREFGLLGCISGEIVEFYRTSTRRHTFNSEFDLENVFSLPKVKIIYNHACEDGIFVEAAINSGVKGIICAAMGNGSISANVERVLERAAAENIVIVRSSRVGSGFVVKNSNFLDAGNLNPQKSRILLQIALTKTNNRHEIQRMFNQY